MTKSKISAILMASLLAAAPAFGQTTQKPKTQDSASSTVTGPGNTATKQRTNGAGPPMVGPASGAYKQRTDGDGPPMIGPASGAYKQRQ